jgi:hypothetical protein
MTTRRGPGAFTTILMLIPMLAVPVMALFGVPHFMPVVASPTPALQAEPFVGFLEPRTGQSDAVLHPVSLRTESQDVDLFQPYGADAATSNQPTLSEAASRISEIRNNWSDPLKFSRISDTARSRSDLSTTEASIEGGLKPGLVTIFDSRPTGRESQVDPATRYERPGIARPVPARLPTETQSMTWRQASQILNDLGVQTYSLSPGLSPGEFRFVCLVSSTDDPRISRRFESNSPDPLVAVEQVITQVKSWTQAEVR